jgi:hypothetical protein
MTDMRKTGIVLAAVAAMAMIGGCRQKTSNGTDVYVRNEKVALADNCPDSLAIKVNLEYPTAMDDKNALPKVTRLIIRTALGDKYDSLGIKEAADTFVADRVKEYRDDNLDLWKKTNGSQGASWLNWEDNISGIFAGSRNDVSSYVVNHYMFQGGAHGISAETAINFNSKTGEEIKESDFFVNGYKDDLSSLLTSHLRESMTDDDAYEALFIKDIEPNGNFKLSDKGVTYVYGEYELGPYYLGIIRVTVPWEELSNSGLIRNDADNKTDTSQNDSK